MYNFYIFAAVVVVVLVVFISDVLVSSARLRKSREELLETMAKNAIAVEKAKQNSLMLQPQSGSGEFVRSSNADRKKLESQAQAIKAKKADSNRSLLLQPIPGSGVHKPRSSKKK